ncbi:MAG TPA: PDZ domain-containing protein [Pyrinomonadaceae bacterium]
MKIKALPLAALALVPASVCAQTVAPAAPPSPAAAVAAPAAPAQIAPPALAAAPQAPAAALALPPAAPRAQTPPSPARAPEAPSGFSTSFLVEGNFLGVRTEEVTRENASRYGLSGEPRGVGVREVVKGSPAEKAGLRAGDVILRFDGEPVTSVRKLTRLVEESAPEHTARLTVLRGGSEQELSATLARREPFVNSRFGEMVGVYPNVDGEVAKQLEERLKNSETWKHNEEQMRRQLEGMGRKYPGLFGNAYRRRIGVTTTALGKQLADYFGVSHGVLVSAVEEGSPAEKAGLRAGDVLTEVDGRQVGDADDLVEALSAKEEGEVTLTVVRDRKQRTVRVTPERRALPGVELMPGSFRFMTPPAVALALPRVTMPRVTMPRITMPRVNVPRVVTPRVRVFRSGDRVL